MSDIQKLYEIERLREVDSITIDGIKIWAFIRNYAGSRLMFKQDRRLPLDAQRFWHIVNNIFYGIRNLFSAQYDNLIVSSSDQRKEVNGQYVDRMDFLEGLIPGRSLHIEFPAPNHYPEKEIPSKHVVSKYVIYFLEIMYGAIKYKKPIIQNEELLKLVLEELSVDEDYDPLVKKFYCQYRVMNWLIGRYGIKRMFIANPYINMGYVLACKKNDCPVAEFQHGIIGSEHYAYNVFKDLGGNLYPDYLLVFGNKEKEIFTKSNYLINSEKVIAVGNFYIDHILKATSPLRLEFIGISNKYKRTVAVSLQDAFEKEIFQFITEAALLDTSICFVMKPRGQESVYYDKFSLPPNVVFFDGHNTYESIKECDFHTTMTSTTAIESPSLGTRNVLMNINNLALEYYGKTLLPPTTFFANSPAELINIINESEKLSRDYILSSNSEIISSGYASNLSAAVGNILNG
jgi:hypothetical protein